MGQSVVLEPVPAGWCCKRSDKGAMLACLTSGGVSAAHLGYGDTARPFASRRSGYLKHRRTASSSFIAGSWMVSGADKAAVGKGGLRHD
ncbi:MULTISPECIES: hypothetical protein [Dickeya]|uniref:hypothetical protein n=1 Tax=Dickeya TaxID=204037 RepID=UPI0008FC13AA|nr:MULTISPECIES: hypothetical protein [Dickeya]MBO8134850.1 hypothetical protein [Dickeya fangzhongdai]UGA52865.1 hypothetical protein QR68_09675 [Dickeya fangzhongdai]UMB78729.1 hypothetical protein FXN80_10165 [Dickeya fangzhongdai]UWH09194.1 hypothetical protein K0H75_09665 [Dickeya fangzhongdai]